ncbi:hypothetical protein PIB30_089694, partial [Stylosanthes scabra]|nr:hypothetical protein [Stylosanthes scabra]
MGSSGRWYDGGGFLVFKVLDVHMNIQGVLEKTQEKRNHEEIEEEEENREQRKLESSYREPKLLQGYIK